MSEVTSEINFDIGTGQLLIGRLAVEQHIGSGGHPADIFPLKELLCGELASSVKFSDTNRGPNRWAHVRTEDIIETGRWLMNIVSDNGSKKLPARTIVLAARLGLIPGREAIESPKRFGSISNFQREIEADKVVWRESFKDWDDIDILIHLHKIGQEEDQRPTMPIIDRRTIVEKRKEPGYRFIKSRIPLPEAYERAGFVFARDWDKRKFDEWGVMFYMANDRVPTRSEMDKLASEGKSPSSSAIYDQYDSFVDFGDSVKKAYENRRALKINDLKSSLRKDEFPGELIEDISDADEAIRRVGRFRTIGLLFPSYPKMQRVRMSMYDVQGQTFVDYLALRDSRIEKWLVEAAALYRICYPELFPGGDYTKSLKV